ncbi:MAG: hypothetical protein WED01_00015, partial [Candidatus Rokuibacteriota bacterium]
AQVFLASEPHPYFTIGPLSVRGTVTPALGPMPVDIVFSVVVPPGRSADIAQDIYLLWPSAITGERGAAGDPTLARWARERGFDVVAEGRALLTTRNLYRRPGDPETTPEPGGAPFVTFARASGRDGLQAAATYVRIPWTPKMVNRTLEMNLKLTLDGVVREKRASWLEQLFWGRRHTLSLGFNNVRQRPMYPVYFEHRDRVIRLADDPSDVTVRFDTSSRLKINEVFPPSASRRVSERRQPRELVSMFLDRSDGITPQVLTVEFGYFTGLQSWAPVLIPLLIFALGNVAGVLIRITAERMSRRYAGRLQFLPRGKNRQPRESGVILSRDTVARLVPGRTTYDDVLKLCGPDPEQWESLDKPERRTLMYRGRRSAVHDHTMFGWLAAVGSWDVEQHELEVELERDVVREVQARVRRSRVTTPDPA